MSTDNLDKKEAFTVEDVAYLLSISASTVRELIERGQLKSILIKTDPRAKKGTRRITRRQLDSFINKCEVEAKFTR